MKRPATFVLILLMATITALASFASGGEGEKGAKVTLRVMNFSQVEKAFVAINAVFMKVHPNIQIVYEPTPNTT